MLSRVLTPLAIASVAIGSAAAAQDQPPIEVWLDQDGGVRFGEAVRVYVRTAYDGHVMVLHADPAGNIDVLLPIDPVADDFARGGRAYEVRGPQNREAFVAGDAEGTGLIYAAYSQDPFLYTNYSVDGRWDTSRLGQIVVAGDAEDELTFLVQQMASGAVFDYNVQQYDVAGPVTYARQSGRYAGYYGYDPYYYDPFYYGPYTSGLSFGFHVGFGHRYYRPWYYDPFYWDPFYDPFFYGYYRPYYRSGYYGGCCSYWPRTVVVFAGNRGYRVNRNYTFKSTQRVRGVDYRPRVRAEGALAASVSGRRGNAINSGRRVAPVRTGATIGRRTLVRDGSAAVDRRTPARITTADRRTVQTTDRRTVQTTPRRAGVADGRRVVRPETPTRRSGAVVTTPDRRTATQAAPTRRSAGQADARRVRRPEAGVPDRSRSAGATPQRVQRQPVSPTRGGRSATSVRRPNGNDPATARRAPDARRSSASAPRPSNRTAVPTRSPGQRSVGGTPARPNRVMTPGRRAAPTRSNPVRARSSETIRRAQPRRANVRPQLQRRSMPRARPSPRSSSPTVRPNVRTSSGRSPVRSAPTRSNRSPVRSAPTRSSSGSSVRRAPTRSSSSSSGRRSSSSSTRRKKK